MIDTINDLSILTSIPEKTLSKLIRKWTFTIAQTVKEENLNENDIIELDIGLGTLYIKILKLDSIKYQYHFEPSDLLKKSIQESIENDTTPLEQLLTESLKQKFTEVYKDLC